MNKFWDKIKRLFKFDFRQILSHSNSSPKDFNPQKIAMQISVIYLIGGSLWILLSDGFFLNFILSNRLVFTISTLKGILYVIITAVMLYFLIKISMIKIQDTNKELIDQTSKLKQIAYKDSLTGLANRTAFYEDANLYLNNFTSSKSALIILNIDRLKYINDTLGHAIGDKVIINTGKRLVKLLDNHKSVYKIGGDEFVVFIRQYKNIEDIISYTEQILQYISVPYNLVDGILNISATIGISLYPVHAKDLDTLLRCADLAIYKAKLIARGSYTIFNEAISNHIQERMTLQNELRGALQYKEFSLHYQPQVNIETGKTDTLEALIRWNNRKLGYVPPMKFISIAEEINLIIDIGEWVLFNSCSFLKKLHEEGYPNICMSVNISIKQLVQQNFIERVMGIISQVGIDPKFIELEITESVLIESYDEIKDKLIQLKSKGFKISLDDFGNGYSSLSYLTNIPINTLKIDKNFIDTISSEDDDVSLTSIIIMIGSRLGLSVVAEGVETEIQLKYLKKHQCNKIQGYYYCKPLPEDDVIDFLVSK